MAERKPRKRPRAPGPPPLAAATDVDDAERVLGRRLSVVLPVATLGAALVVGAIAGVGSALLVLAAGTLLGTIGLLWASVRTLSGDAPLSMGLEALAARRHSVDALGEQKRRVLRALKDLENEHAVGKIDATDYADFVAKYREEAKAVMRKMDLRVAPLRAEAERMARDYMADRGIGMPEGSALQKGEAEPVGERAAPKARASSAAGRVACAGCNTSNEGDAEFCKKCGAVLAAGRGS